MCANVTRQISPWNLGITSNSRTFNELECLKHSWQCSHSNFFPRVGRWISQTKMFFFCYFQTSPVEPSWEQINEMFRFLENKNFIKVSHSKPNPEDTYVYLYDKRFCSAKRYMHDLTYWSIERFYTRIGLISLRILPHDNIPKQINLTMSNNECNNPELLNPY